MLRVALLVVLGGCSMFFTSSPEPEKPCNTSEAAPIADGAFAGLYAVGAVAAIQESATGSDETAAAILSVAAGALFAASAVHGFNNIGQCRRHQQELYDDQQAEAARPVATPTRVKSDAWQLTQQAAAAARAGDCASVVAIDEVVRNMDLEFHRTVFMRDIAIVRCMTSTEVPVSSPSETPPVAPVPVTPGPVAPAPTPTPP